jgi:methylenetetrahydrofolate reductase (NADPH)
MAQIPPPPARSKGFAVGTSYVTDEAEETLPEENSFAGPAPSPNAFKLSFEFFPPHTPEGLGKLKHTARTLAMLYPAYYSVTFGAGGNMQTNTLNTVQELQRLAGTPIAPHISCIGSTPESIRQLINTYKQADVRRLVVLRGDVPSGMMRPGYFRYAKDLIAFIRAEIGDHFWIEVAAYPECHPEASCPDSDLKNFKAKVDAGANSALTQYFYNIDSYNYFIDRCNKANITIPIVPGIMPINNYKQLKRFSDNCGAEIPRWINLRLAKYADNPASLKKFGIEVVTNLAQRLLDQGAPGLHFYTLNNADTTMAICQKLSWKK